MFDMKNAESTKLVMECSNGGGSMNFGIRITMSVWIFGKEMYLEMRST